MWIIIKSEIKYYIHWILLAVFLPVSFTIFGLFDIRFFENIPFLKKYFWDIYVAFGFYSFALLVWLNRAKEKRDRLIALLPAAKSRVAIARYVIGLAPLVIIISYIEFTRLILPYDWHEYIGKVNVQLVFFAIFLSFFSIVVDFGYYKFKTENIRIAKTVMLIVMLVLPAVIVVYSDLEGYLPGIGVLEERLYFYLLTLFYFTLAGGVFYNRKSYLA